MAASALSKHKTEGLSAVFKSIDFWACFLISAILIFYLATTRSSHSWGDDFSQYIIHAINIAEGIPYKETGHILNKANSIAPETYPPVFPMLLVPAYYFFGLNLYAFKVVGILCFAVFLLRFYFVSCRYIKAEFALCIIFLISLNPFIWDFKDQILSEFPFLCFLFGAFGLLFFMPPKLSFRKAVFWYALAGLAFYLVIGCRTIGMVLLPAFIAHELFRKSKSQYWYLFIMLPIVVCGVLLLLQKLYLNSTGEGYLFQLSSFFSIPQLQHNSEAYIKEFTNFLVGNPLDAKPEGWQKIFFTALAFTSLAGLLISFKNKVSIVEFFAVAYLIGILLWPMYQGMRFMLPLVPLFFLYIFVFLQWLPFLNKEIRVVVLTLSGVLTCSYLFFLERADYQIVSWEIHNADTKELFSFVSYSPEDAVFIFDKPRALRLFTNRAAGIHHCTENIADFGNYIKEIQASYLILYKWDSSCAPQFIASNPDKQKKVFENTSFVVYRFSPEFLK